MSAPAPVDFAAQFAALHARVARFVTDASVRRKGDAEHAPFVYAMFNVVFKEFGEDVKSSKYSVYREYEVNAQNLRAFKLPPGTHTVTVVYPGTWSGGADADPLVSFLRAHDGYDDIQVAVPPQPRPPTRSNAIHGIRSPVRSNATHAGSSATFGSKLRL